MVACVARLVVTDWPLWRLPLPLVWSAMHSSTQPTAKAATTPHTLTNLPSLPLLHTGHPYDWHLYMSLTTIGILSGVTARQFAQHGNEETTYLLTLIAGLTCFGINGLRWLLDYGDMRRGSLLQRQLDDAEFARVKRLWCWCGFLTSAHQWHLGYKAPTITTLILHIFGILLTLTAQITIAMAPSWENGAINAFDALRATSITMLLLLLLLWLKDGLLLFTNRVDLRGETVVVNEVDEDDGGGAEGDLADIDDADADGEFKPIKPPPTWRHFRTHLGTSYYYDPATEMIHYLSRTGQGNYVVDPVYNCTLTYDSLIDLQEKMRNRGLPGYGIKEEEVDQAKAGADAGRSATRRQALERARRAAQRGETSGAARGGGAAAEDQQV